MIRTKNVTERGSCDWCRDTGYVADAGPDGKGYDSVLAPCPFCEAGYREEFPDVDPKHRDHRILPPWNIEKGYWQGRSLNHLEPERKGPEISLSLEQRKEHAKVMGKVLGFTVKGIDEA